MRTLLATFGLGFLGAALTGGAVVQRFRLLRVLLGPWRAISRPPIQARIRATLAADPNGVIAVTS